MKRFLREIWLSISPKPMGTDPLYMDHLKVFELREYLRGIKGNTDDWQLVIRHIRDIVGDAEYAQF